MNTISLKIKYPPKKHTATKPSNTYLIQNRLTKPHLDLKICLTLDFFKSNVLFLYLSPMQMSMNEKKMYKL